MTAITIKTSSGQVFNGRQTANDMDRHSAIKRIIKARVRGAVRVLLWFDGYSPACQVATFTYTVANKHGATQMAGKLYVSGTPKRVAKQRSDRERE